MASADSPTPLSAGASPGQGLFFPFAPLGSTECHQWLLGFVVPSTSTLAPDILPHCPFVFLRSNVCLPPFRAASLRRRPGGSATVGTTSPRREPFIPPDQTPAGHTRPGPLTRRTFKTRANSSFHRLSGLAQRRKTKLLTVRNLITPSGSTTPSSATARKAMESFAREPREKR